jgi:hypothetical protein
MFEGALLVELFCQTVYQIGSNSTNRTVYGAKAKKCFTSEVVFFLRCPQIAYM